MYGASKRHKSKEVEEVEVTYQSNDATSSPGVEPLFDLVLQQLRRVQLVGVTGGQRHQQVDGYLGSNSSKLTTQISHQQRAPKSVCPFFPLLSFTKAHTSLTTGRLLGATAASIQFHRDNVRERRDTGAFS